MAKMKREFYGADGTCFHLNDNHNRNEYEPRFVLMYWNTDRQAWHTLAKVNTKREALEYVRGLRFWW